jgi:hypothetical protein
MAKTQESSGLNQKYPEVQAVLIVRVSLSVMVKVLSGQDNSDCLYSEKNSDPR